MPTESAQTIVLLHQLQNINPKERQALKAIMGQGGGCICGEPAVVRYFGGGDPVDGHTWRFDWPRCMACPGVRRAHGHRVQAIPMAYHHRQLLRLLGDEEAFIAAVRLGYRPPSYDDQTNSKIDGHVHIDINLWEQHQ